jgi:hypothetical protein
LAKYFYRENQTQRVPLASDDPLKARERARFDLYAIASAYEWMGLHTQRAINHPSDGDDFVVGNFRGDASCSNDRVNPGRG